MIISSSVVAMNASSQLTTTTRSTEQLTSWAGGQQNAKTQSSGEEGLSLMDIMKKLKENLQYDAVDNTSYVAQYEVGALELSEEDQRKIDLLNRLLDALIGKKLKFVLPQKMILKPAPVQLSYGRSLQKSQGIALQGWGLSYQKNESYSEEESMSFSSEGRITTADGRTISFGVDLNLSRSFVSQSSFSIKAGDALLDPLVINYEQGSVGLTEQKYSFDLDLDGKNDQISFTKKGSGFLVYDKNGDGTINHGGEMFGPKTGNGFLELSQYDSDGNNWIDENDPIFDKLQIWTKDKDGKDQLFAIGKKGIGAIYLGSVNSPYSLKDNNNDILGQIRQTGIFLKENGAAGTIQHIDISL